VCADTKKGIKYTVVNKHNVQPILNFASHFSYVYFEELHNKHGNK